FEREVAPVLMPSVWSSLDVCDYDMNHLSVGRVLRKAEPVVQRAADEGECGNRTCTDTLCKTCFRRPGESEKALALRQHEIGAVEVLFLCAGRGNDAGEQPEDPYFRYRPCHATLHRRTERRCRRVDPLGYSGRHPRALSLAFRNASAALLVLAPLPIV